MSSKAAVLRVTPEIRAKLSRSNALRLDQVLNLIGSEGKAILAEILKELYPRQNRERALTSFRQFRRALAMAAKEAGAQLTLETDGQTRSSPENREVWFEAEDRLTEEVKRLVGNEIGDVERTPQDVVVEPVIRFFVSYAHKDADLKDKLLDRLRTCLDIHPHARFEIWTDGEILPGKQWRDEIQKAMEACDFGLLLVSPAFLASKFITHQELPYFLQNRRIVPVGLKPVLFDGSMDLKGLEERQLFFDERKQTFIDQTTSRTQDRFALQLFQAIGKLLAEEPGQPKAALGHPRLDRHLRSALADFDEQRFVPTEGVMTTLHKDLERPPEIDPRQRKDAVQFLTEWVTDENAPPYCALLGEYGMGKTTTCKALARDLLNKHDQGKKVLLPIYLDLRNVGAAARRGLVLEEILELIIRNSWKSGPEGTSLSAREVIALVQNEGALVIWDGLDEVLVHLDPDPGQKFTRQLFRILPPARKGQSRRGRMLISCRTHYFRTLRDQQTHFRAEDRDSVRKEDYRAPFVLLPFTPKQIREYLEHSLPGEDPGRVMEVFKTVHNLTEMAERPYTLGLITEHFAQIEKWKAEGRRVTGLMLYRHMVLSWLERDQGKHQFTTDHKQALMEYFAAELWRAGARSWSVSDLEHWLIDFLQKRQDLAAHYEGKDRELLKEDLRTATFLVREGEDRFRFAHASLQEYFLAGYLRRALIEKVPERWAMPGVSTETLGFLGQWLQEDRDNQNVALSTLEALRDSYYARATELAFSYYLLASRRGYPSPTPAGFQLPGADLAEWIIKGEDGHILMLAGMNLRGANISNTHWEFCNLEEAVFDAADASRSEWLSCHLAAGSWQGALLEATVYRDCEMGSANFEGGLFQRTQWLRCTLGGATGLPDERHLGLYALCLHAPAIQAPPQSCSRLHVLTGHTGSVRDCAWSPDGLRLLSASADKTLRVWDAKSGKCLATFSGHQGWVTGCAWSPDGLRLLSASYDHTLRLWDAKSGKCLATLSGHQRPVTGCAWSPDGLRLLSASADHTLRLWDAKSGKCLATLSGHQGPVTGCAWSPDGLRLLSASADHTLRLWDAKSGKCLATLSGHQGWVNGCAWSPDGLRLLSASYDNTLRLWDAKSGKCLATLSGHQNWVYGCAWSPDGLRLLSASYDSTLRLWDAKNGKCLATLSGHQNWVYGCAWSPDGLRLLSASYDSTLRLWDAKSGKCLATLSGHQNWVYGCAWSSEGLRLLSASYDHTLRLWDAKSGKCLATLSGHQDSVTGCAWSPDGLRLLSTSADHTLRLWDAKSGKCLATFSGHQNWVTGCAWSPDGLRLLSASADKTLRLWDAKSGKCLATLSGHQDSVNGCAWSPDGLRLLSASYDNTLRLWDAKSGKCLATLSGHQDSVNGCAWSPDGLRLLSASYDNTLRLWDAKSGKCLATLSGHQDSVTGCAWSPDGLRLLSASADHTLRLWDAKSGKCLATLSGHQGPVNGCAWSPDGLRLLSISNDGSLRIWSAQTTGQLAPEVHQSRSPDGLSTWCAIDSGKNQILACGAEAWRILAWVIPDEASGLPELLPAETFGPLPIVESV